MSAPARPASGVRYVVERTLAAPDLVTYEGFAHLPDADVPLTVRVALPGGAVTASVAPHAAVEARSADLSRVAAALVRAATKAEVASGQALPRKIARWRG